MTVRAALLHLLTDGDRHGYQLKVEFETRTGGIWPLNVGQVYTTLDRLVRDGLVTEQGEREGNRQTYRITEDGRREVKEWLAAATTESGPPRDELLMKVLLAIGAGPATALPVIDDHRRDLLAALQTGRRRRRALKDAPAVERLAHDALLSRIEADVHWLDRCEQTARAEDGGRP